MRGGMRSGMRGKTKGKDGSPIKPRRKTKFVRKTCRLCENKMDKVDFKDSDFLKKFQTEKGKVLIRRYTGNCMRHQKMVAAAIKRARELSLVY